MAVGVIKATLAIYIFSQMLRQSRQGSVQNTTDAWTRTPGPHPGTVDGVRVEVRNLTSEISILAVTSGKNTNQSFPTTPQVTSTGHPSAPGDSGSNSSTQLVINASATSDVWTVGVNTALCVIASTGALANALVLIVLTKGVKMSPVLILLFKHQCCADIIVCIFSAIISKEQVLRLFDDRVIDHILCHVWHSQSLYWLFVFVSAQNLVLIASERYLAVCKPFLFLRVKPKTTYLVLVGVYIYSTVCSLPLFFVREFVDGLCVEDMFDTQHPIKFQFFRIYPYIWLTTFYLLPTVSFCVFYANVLRGLKQSLSMKNTNKQKSNSPVGKAASELTKTAITVTIIFVVCMSFETFCYLLYGEGIITYVSASPIQKIGVFLTVANSVANPFIYTACMPVFRESYKSIFCFFRL